MTPIGRRAKEPQPAMVIVGKGIKKTKSNAGSDVGDDGPRCEVAHACVRMISVLGKPVSGMVD